MIRIQAHDGREAVDDFELHHGADPLAELMGRGWTPTGVSAAGVLGDLTLMYAVEPVPAVNAAPPPPSDLSGLPQVRRVAAYAVIIEHGRLLLTELSEHTTMPGWWTLPGGGLDLGETPADAVTREVAEETGQLVVDVELVGVSTMRQAGESRWGVKDYQAVRLLYTAHCPDPGPPVVHDVGGSTRSARWVPLSDVSSLDTVETVSSALEAAGIAGVI